MINSMIEAKTALAKDERKEITEHLHSHQGITDVSIKAFYQRFLSKRIIRCQKHKLNFQKNLQMKTTKKLTIQIGC